MYLKLPNIYPYTIADLRADHPDISFPADVPLDVLAGFDVVPVTDDPQPLVNRLTHRLKMGPPKCIGGEWRCGWIEEKLTRDERLQAIGMFRGECERALDVRLDLFAAGRGYRDMVAVCSYATSKHPSYGADGKFAVVMRDKCWDALWEALDKVEKGEIPALIDEVMAYLPALAWPS